MDLAVDTLMQEINQFLKLLFRIILRKFIDATQIPFVINRIVAQT